MILRDAREVALDEVRRALSEVLRDESPLVLQRAENLVAIAEAYEVRIEDLIIWIHCSLPDKQWTSAEFKRWCVRYREAVAACPAAAAIPPPPQWELCRQCYERVAHLVNGTWFCDHCGVIAMSTPNSEPSVPLVN